MCVCMCACLCLCCSVDLNQLVVTLEVENKCELTGGHGAVELRVSQISCLSSSWQVQKLDRQQGLLCLLPSESGVIHLKGVRTRPPEDAGRGLGERGDGKALVHSDVPLGPTLVSLFCSIIKYSVKCLIRFSF